MQHIPYKGSPPALTDVMGGQVSMTFDNITTAWPLAKGGKLKALAVTTAKRSPVAPDVPTLAESGLPGYEVGSWQGVFAPAGTPPEIVKRLNTEIVKIINMPDVQKKMIELGAEPVGNTLRGVRRVRQDRGGQVGRRREEVRREGRLMMRFARSDRRGGACGVARVGARRIPRSPSSSSRRARPATRPT